MSSMTAQERLEFLRTRQEGIGGSDVGKILGFSQWGDALDVYHDMTRPITMEMIQNEEVSIHRLRGNVLEPEAVRAYWTQTGREGRAEKTWTKHPDREGLLAHVDGTIFSDPGRDAPKDETGVLEVKCPGLHRFGDLADSGLRESELLQMQFYLAVTRRPWGGFCFYSLEHNAGPVIDVDVTADEEMGRYLLERMEEFWRKHVVERIPPDPEAWAHDETRPPVRETTGEVVTVVDPEAEEIGRALIEAKELKSRGKKLYDEKKKEMEAWIEENVEDSDRIQIPGVGKMTVVHNSGRVSFNRDALEGHRPIDRDAFVRAVKRGEIILEVKAGDELQTAEEIADATADMLRLDLSKFEKQGSPYSYLRPTPA